MQNYIETSLDKDFLKIENLKYLPWVGKKALNQDQKLLIIGESVYNWEKDKETREVADEAINNNNFSRIVAYEHGIEYPSSKRKVARNIEKLFDIDYKNKDKRNGLPLRNLLRQLDEDNLLYLIPQVSVERKDKNRYWFFNAISV